MWRFRFSLSVTAKLSVVSRSCAFGIRTILMDLIKFDY